MKTSFALAFALQQVLGVGSLSECLSEEDVALVDISTIQYSMSWEMTIEPGDSCYHLTFASVYASWQRDADISVKYQTYRQPMNTEEACQPVGKEESYVSGTLLHTDQTVWPYTEPDVCAYLFVFTNDSPDFGQVVNFFTNGSTIGFAMSMVSLFTAAYLAF